MREQPGISITNPCVTAAAYQAEYMPFYMMGEADIKKSLY